MFRHSVGSIECISFFDPDKESLASGHGDTRIDEGTLSNHETGSNLISGRWAPDEESWGAPPAADGAGVGESGDGSGEHAQEEDAATARRSSPHAGEAALNGGDSDCCSTAAAADEEIESAGVGGVCRQSLEGTVREAARHEVDVVVEDGVGLADVIVGEVDAGENGTQVEMEKDGMHAGAGICV